MNVYILLFSANYYDFPEYEFVEFFADFPSKEQLIEQGVRPKDVEHVLGGGGRRGNEDQWYTLQMRKV
jgi:hypothetical protein